MDLPASSSSLVPAAVPGTAVKTRTAWSQFGRGGNGQFSASMGTIGSNVQIWQFRRRANACMGVVGKGTQGKRSGAERGGRKSVVTQGAHRDGGVMVTQQCWFVDAFVCCKNLL